jgi:ABC-type uncharacterized transport system fused permease/ATPase subunit
MMQFYRQVWQPFWSVTRLYWTSSEKWRAIAILLFLMLLSLLNSVSVVAFSVLLGELTNPLASRDLEQFIHSLVIFVGVVAIAVPLFSLKPYVQSKLGLYWRRWLTNYFLQHYFAQQAFYRLESEPTIDNPDQRIAEDIKNFTQQALVFGVIFSDSIWQLIGFSGVLWSTSQPLMGLLVAYAVLGNWITAIVFGRALIGINIEQLKRETNFRFGLARLRENAEAIAFYQGEAQEAENVRSRFREVFSNFNRLIRWQLNLDGFQNSYQYVTFFLPALVLAPKILAGELPVGAFVQAGIAFKSILNALGVIINQFEQFSAFAASVTRLEALLQFNQADLEAGGIEIRESDRLVLEQVNLWTPQQTPLIRDLNLSLLPGQSLLIMGASGVGKTSLLRAIAGLWTTGNGVIHRPPREQLLFLPQRPYLTIGSLREQLLYPRSVPLSDEELSAVLEQVNLLEVVQRFGGLDIAADWAQVLSGGEQQRLGFARLLVQKPRYALLDEATSALDKANEIRLYNQLQGTTYISIGHRTSLIPLHDLVLELLAD